jgi:Lar family restriction alleviation protein
MTIELLPCPFCGKENRSVYHGATGWPKVICIECRATGPEEQTEWEAVESWNMRSKRGLGK